MKFPAFNALTNGWDTLGEYYSATGGRTKEGIPVLKTTDTQCVGC